MKNIAGFLSTCLFVTVFLCSCSVKEYRNVHVIPYPESVKVYGRPLDLAGELVISADELVLPEANFLSERLGACGYDTEVALHSDHPDIVLNVKKGLPAEGYRLDIGLKKIVVSGGSASGVFYGIQTFLQMLENASLYRGTVTDAPRYAWRGFMLDESRHFSGEERVKKLLDIMAYYKLNKFHWHLTDSQGWRIEIKSYPDLALIGGKGSHSDPDAPASYYTQEQIREIVEYAAARHIEVVPEIDMPGHATAANRAYPQYNGGGSEQFPDFTFNVGKEETYSYLTDILREVAGLFPSMYLHLGGDEVSYGIEAWEKDPDVRSLMEREGLSTVKDAEKYFMLRMADSVAVLGKTLVGWDELVDKSPDTDRSVVMWWRHDKPDYLDRSLAAGYPTVMCPRKPLYFDFVQHDTHEWGRIWDGFCPIEDVYSFPDPWIEQLSQEQKSRIIGIQANLWCELNHTPERVDFMTFPRLCALAEAAWTVPAAKDAGSFADRLEDAYRFLDALGIYYFDTRDPGHHPEPAGPIIKKKGEAVDYRD